jgi:hypothetical protein
LRVFYYLVQDLKVPRLATWGGLSRCLAQLLILATALDALSTQCLIFSLIALHFKIKPSQFRSPLFCLCLNCYRC